MAVELIMSISGGEDDSGELHSLYSAPLDDDELRPVRTNLVTGTPVSGRLGAEEIIRIVVESKPLLASVTACTTAWITARNPKVHFTIGETTINLDGRAAHDENVRRAIELAQALDNETPR